LRKFLALSAFGEILTNDKTVQHSFRKIVDVVFYLNESFCSGVSLLKIIGNSNWIKFSNWIVSFKYNRWIFPGRTRFYLRPWDFCIFSDSSFVTKLKTPPLPSLFPGYQFVRSNIWFQHRPMRLIPLLRHAAGFRHDSVRCSLVTYVTSFICN
jgi:hypothetical protein